MTKKTKSESDRRRAQRLSIPIKVEYKMDKKQGAWKKCTSKDIGGLGFGLYLNSPLKVGDNISIAVGEKSSKSAITLLCKVVRCIEIKKGEYETGVEVVDVNDPSRFIAFICDKMIDLKLSK